MWAGLPERARSLLPPLLPSDRPVPGPGGGDQATRWHRHLAVGGGVMAPPPGRRHCAAVSARSTLPLHTRRGGGR